jgi:succinate dehydrogenase hydrophobic anchor subunit
MPYKVGSKPKERIMTNRNVKAGWNFEYLMWLFTRISGLLMILLALVGFTAAMIMGARTQMDLPTLVRWTFFPNPNHVLVSDIPDIDMGWANGFWITMQILVIVFAGTHAWNGLRMILEDYIGSTGLRNAIRVIIFILWLASMVVANVLILTSWAYQ